MDLLILAFGMLDIGTAESRTAPTLSCNRHLDEI